MIEVKLKHDNGRKITVDRALKILKRKIDKEGVLKEVKKRRFFEKKSFRQYKKNKKAKYIAKMISEENKLWR